MDVEMSWRIIYLIIDTGMVAAALILWPRAPDIMQRVMLTLVVSAGLIYASADILGIASELKVWKIKVIASRFEHFAMLVYLLRQMWIRSEICQSVKSLGQHHK